MHNIKRRDFLKTLGLGGAAIGLSGFGLSVGKLQKHQKPNILFIMADDPVSYTHLRAHET